MERRQIIQRAFSIDTSIDPSEDAGQLRLFLQSVEKALSQRTGTSIDIVQSDDAKQIKLRTSTPLPGNLQPLEWNIQLVPALQFMMTTEFVVHLLSQQSTARLEKNSLMQQIRYRDHIIGKLVERMQSDGVDLSKVFPGAASSKVGTGSNARQVIGKSVKGLAEFDVVQWQSRIVNDNEVPKNMEDLLTSVLSIDLAEESEGVNATDVQDFGTWWTHLRHDNSLPKPTADVPVKSDTEEDVAVESGFQTQSPPSMFHRNGGYAEETQKVEVQGLNPLSEQNNSASASTTDESDDALQALKPDHPPPVARNTQAGALSTRGRMSHTPPSIRVGSKSIAKETPNDAHVPQAAIFSNSHYMNSSSDDDAMDLSRKSSISSNKMVERQTSDHPQPATKPKLKMGKIGGKPLKPAVEDVPHKSNPQVSKSKPKLGRIGGVGGIGKIGHVEGSQTKGNQPAATVSEEQSLLSKQNLNRERQRHLAQDVAQSKRPSTMSPRAPSPPRETDEERANKKREKLKRELESKSQAGMKKKRKF